MLDGLFGRGFSAKCKVLIKATRVRIQMVRRRVEAKQRFLKEDLAKLLSSGLDVNAYERMEEFVAGMTLLSFYDFVERACEHISKQASKMQKLGDCPEECREDVSLLMFAAARFADLPELRDLRDIFRERYGPCLEVSSNHKFAERLSPAPPTTEKKIQVMQSIASEFSIKWDAKGFEERMVNPPRVAPVGLPRTEKVKQKPELPFEGRQGSYGDNGIKWRREEAECYRGKNSVKNKEGSVLKEDVRNHVGGVSFYEKQKMSKSKHADLFEEEFGKELKVQNLGSSSQGKMQERDERMRIGIGKLKPGNGGSTDALRHEKVEFSSDRVEHSGGNKTATSLQRQTDQDVIQKAEKQEKKTDEAVKSFSNGIPPPYLKANDNFPAPPYTKPKEDCIRTHRASKSEAPDMDVEFASHSSRPVGDATGNSKKPGHPSSEKVARAVGVENLGIGSEHQDLNIPLPTQGSVRRKHHKSSSSSMKNHSGKGLQRLFTEEEHHRKDEEEILMDRLLLHYSKKPSLYDAEKLPKSGGRRSHGDYGGYIDDANRKEAPAPSRSTSLPREPPTSSSAGTKKVLNRASTFQPDNQAKHVHPKLPDYDDLAAKFAALKGR